MNRVDEKFQQPVDAIRVISRAEEPRTKLTPEALQDAIDRVRSGVSEEEVAEDLAVEQVADETLDDDEDL
jgi:hypothetical protein